MNVPADDDWLILEVLYFSAGLRSLVISADSQQNPTVRPVSLPEIEKVGLDNDVELKPGDRVVDFSRFDVQSSDARHPSIYWLGMYCHAVDSVGDRSNFLGVGVWFRSDRTLRHQLVLDTLAATLDDLSGSHLNDLQRRSSDLIANLQTFRRELNRTVGIPVQSCNFGLANADTADVSRAYVRTSKSESSLIKIAGALSTLLLPNRNAKNGRPSRILFLLGPDLPKVPRRSWVLFNDLAELTGGYSAVDSLLESVLGGQSDLRDEIGRLRETELRLAAALEVEQVRSAAQSRELGATQLSIGDLERDLAQNKQWLLVCKQERSELETLCQSQEQLIIQLNHQLSSQGSTGSFSGVASNGSVPGGGQKQHSVKGQVQPTNELGREIIQIRKLQEQRFAESQQSVNRLSDRLADLPAIATTTRNAVFVLAIALGFCSLALAYLTYVSVTAEPQNSVEPRSSQSPPFGTPARTPSPASPSVPEAAAPEATKPLPQ